MRASGILSLILLAHKAAAVTKIYISQSCGRECVVSQVSFPLADTDVDYIPMLVPAIDSTLLRAKLAEQKLKEWQEYKRKKLKPTPELLQIDRLVGWLFTFDGAEDARSRFEKISKFEFDGEFQGLWDDSQRGKIGDVIIYCDLTRYTFNDNTRRWHDLVNSISMSQAEYQGLGAAPICYAATSQNAGPPNIAVSCIELTSPWLVVMWGMRSRGEMFLWNSGDDADRSVAASIKETMTNDQSTRPWVDEISECLDGVLSHEITHVVSAGLSRDIERMNSYGWANAVRLHRSDNAGECGSDVL
ncbi:hypothetical protein FKW77_000393 [Venturia effusa]|uniref:Lysine-specific metallo-endopeptidase domain-containing protein n=1 Tax=Venturia effusa TaxID=50376 RepID=A0A517L2J8_9PEZI|nr:hypothetical protein FKW77_000393 [Venturia effusa]